MQRKAEEQSIKDKAKHVPDAVILQSPEQSAEQQADKVSARAARLAATEAAKSQSSTSESPVKPARAKHFVKPFLDSFKGFHRLSSLDDQEIQQIVVKTREARGAIGRAVNKFAQTQLAQHKKPKQAPAKAAV